MSTTFRTRGFLASTRIDGEWCECDDGFVRPVIRGEVLSANGIWQSTPFLVDTGADRTVFSAAVGQVLGFEAGETQESLGGLGGIAKSFAMRTQIRFPRHEGGDAVFRGVFPAILRLESLDISVLGSDILGKFAAIVDRPGSIVVLISQRHRYRIETGLI